MPKITAAIMALCVAGIAACASLMPLPTTLPQAQAEAQAILAAVQASISVYETSPNADPATVKRIDAAMTQAQVLVASFTSKTTLSSNDIARAVVNSLMTVVTVLPIDPITKTEVDLGLAVIDAFVAALPPPAAPAPVVAAAKNRRAITLRVHGAEPPVPIHVPEAAH